MYKTLGIFVRNFKEIHCTCYDLWALDAHWLCK